MNLAAQLKSLVSKKPALAANGDERRKGEPLAGGRRAGENDNPYLSARRTWNDHVGSVVSSRQTWQVIGLLSLLIALAGVGGMLHIGSQSKFVPYIVEVDKLSQPLAMYPAQRTAAPDARLLTAAVAAFISDARMVTPDVSLQRKAVFRIYSELAPNDPATAKMNEYLNGSDESSPFKRAAKETVSVEITSAMAQTPDTWQVDWVETVRDRQGVLKGKPFNMRALVTVYTIAPTTQTTEEQIRNNPASIYIRDFTWSKQL